MIQISKFKLLDHGRGGIEIEGKESMVMEGGYAVLDKIKRERRLMLAPDVIAKIQELKYFFFNLTGHWVAPFNKYYDLSTHRLKDIELDEKGEMKPGQNMLRTLWSRTDITGLSYKNGGFVITGQIETVEGKRCVINTPFITENDDIGFFSDAIEKMNDCIMVIIEYLSMRQLPKYDPQSVLTAEEMSDGDINSLSRKVVDKLIDRGLIVLINELEDDHPQLPFNGTTVHSETGSIDGDNIPHAEEEEQSIEELAEFARIKDEEIKRKLNPPLSPYKPGEAVTDEYPVQDGDYRGEPVALGKDLEMHEYGDGPVDESPDDMKFD
jgi:hypothetical protein